MHLSVNLMRIPICRLLGDGPRGESTFLPFSNTKCFLYFFVGKYVLSVFLINFVLFVMLCPDSHWNEVGRPTPPSSYR